MSRPSIILLRGALVDGVDYRQEFRFLVAQSTSAPGINYLADVVEDVFFKTMSRQSMSLSKSNWSLTEAGLARAFAFHMAVVTGAPMIVILVVLVYLDRMRFGLVIPHACLVHGLVPERLLLGAWIIAFQSLYGIPDNRFQIWADATKMFTPKEVEQTVDEISRVLGNDFSFTEIDMRVHCNKMIGFYETWQDFCMQDVHEHHTDVVDERPVEVGTQDCLQHTRVPIPGLDLTGGVERRSVRLVCRSTGSY